MIRRRYRSRNGVPKVYVKTVLDRGETSCGESIGILPTTVILSLVVIIFFSTTVGNFFRRLQFFLPQMTFRFILTREKNDFPDERVVKMSFLRS